MTMIIMKRPFDKLILDAEVSTYLSQSHRGQGEGEDERTHNYGIKRVTDKTLSRTMATRMMATTVGRRVKCDGLSLSTLGRESGCSRQTKVS